MEELAARATGSAVAGVSSIRTAKPAPQSECSEVKAIGVRRKRSKRIESAKLRKGFGCTCATQKKKYKDPG